jgi:excisionase family DNA binding protein
VSDRLLTAAELAEQLGLSPATIVDWAEAGRLPGFRLGGSKGGRLRFRACEVEAVLESWRFGRKAAPTGPNSETPSQRPREGVQ